jgi:hypothetical protein
VPLAAGDVIAGYTVVRQLGSGGMGAVYLVRHPRLPRLDALKLLKAEFSVDPDFSRRFLREADVVAGLSHRNIVPVLDRGEDRGQLWLTMQFVDGIDAEQALADAGGLLPAERVAHIVTEVAAALDAAHRHHLIHRDVKPANILLSRSSDDDDEQVFLTDFGIAKSLETGNTRLTRTGAVLATFDYASPEQIESRSPDGRSDIYSLACVLYKLLTGSVPYPGPGVAAAIHGHLQLPPPRPTKLVPWLAPRIDEVLARAMSKDPAERFPNCRAFAAAATVALNDYPPPPGPPYTVQLTAPTGAVLGPMTTDRLSHQETERLVDLVRRTRFFDLPENLHEVAGRTTTGHRPRGGRPVTLEIRSGRSVRKVVADLDEARRPASLDALVEAVERLQRPPDRAPEPVTTLNDLRAAQAAVAARSAQTPPAGAAQAPARGAAPAARAPHPPIPAPSSDPHTPQPASFGVPPPAASARSTGPTGPYGPAYPSGPGTPWTPPPGPPEGSRRRGRLLLVLVLVLVLAATAVTVWLLTRGDDDPPGGGEPGGSSGTDGSEVGDSTTPAELAYENLPRAAALPPATMVVSLDVEGNTDLYLVDATTGTRTTRLTDAPEPDFSPLIAPDRSTIVYLRGAGDGNEARTVAADGSGDRPLFPAPLSDCLVPMRPAWNPDDPTQLAIACHDDPDATSLRLMALDGTVVRELPRGPAVADDVTFSPDGTRIAYWGNEPGSGAGDLYIVPTDGSAEPERLTDSGADNDAVWSPDGEQIAFARSVGGGSREIHVVNADGSGVRSITSGGYVDQGPSWSPDGSMVTFKSNRPAGDGVSGDHLWVMEISGGTARELEAGGLVVSSPTWGRR